MRLLTSLFLALLALGSALADGFGRFGYRDLPLLPGFNVNTEGFVAKTGGADLIRFGKPGRTWRPVATDEFGQTVALGASSPGPQKIRYNLWYPGFSLFYDHGFEFKMGSTGSPYLTWGEGTVADGVPTPDAPWILISFKTAQPPILLILESGTTASFSIVGQAGDWTLKTEKPYHGWVRVVQPLGTAEVAANSAASLGVLTKRVFDNISLWTQPEPVFQNLTVTGDGTAVEATWTFDHPGALVPLGAAMANLGGYPIRILSKMRRLNEWNDEGPITVLEEPTLKIRFPVRRIPLGRSLAVGKRVVAPFGTISPIDIPSVVELAMENLLADRDLSTQKIAEDAYSSYLLDATYSDEPVTGQKLPFNAQGTGIDLAACHALLMQATTISSQSTSEANSLLTSVTWRRDAYSWRVAVDDDVLARRAGALAALAGFLCPEPERRLQAAMFEAGLAAERGIAILRARKAGQPEPKLLEPMDGLRRYAFFRVAKVAEEDLFAKSLFSEIRVFGDTSASLEKQGEALRLSWEAADTSAHQIVFATAYPIDFELATTKKLDVERALGLTQVRYAANEPGLCQATLRRPDWAKPLPDSASAPHYSEPVK